MVSSRVQPRRKAPIVWGGIVWTAGLLGAGIAYGLVDDRIINVVSYAFVRTEAPPLLFTRALPIVALFFLLVVALRRRAPGSILDNTQQFDELSPILRMSAARAGLPLVLTIFVASAWAMGFAPNFVTMSIAIVGLAWSMDRLGGGVSVADETSHLDRWAPVALAAAVVASTAWHTLQQVHFWQHFMLGYADFGLFTTELEHCLPWKDVGSARFSDTRMGYHCVPMFYLLAPAYAICRSPVFLMVIGSLALNLAAIPFYQLARHRTRSATVGLLVGLSWLALPSISRLPYSNTYGFQSIYLAVPWLAWTFSLAMQNRWRGSHWCLAAAMLCEETVCGVALGWGLYLVIWGGRRRAGMWIVAVSIAYLLLCTAVIIPTFEGSGQYTRLMLFGDISPLSIVDRLTRSRVPLYLLALAGPMLVALVRSWRILIVALPTLSLVLVMHQTDYLNIKYWHHSSLLPVLFAAATMGVTLVCGPNGRVRSADRYGLGVVRSCADTNGSGSGKREGTPLGGPIGLLVCILLFHFWMGSSPFAQSQRLYAADRFLQKSDPRLAVVDFVRATFPPEQTTVVATERMAAHFTGYRMVHAAPRARLADTTGSPHVLIIDRSDRWDKIGMEHSTNQTLAQAAAAGFILVHKYGPVLILANEEARRVFSLNGVDR